MMLHWRVTEKNYMLKKNGFLKGKFLLLLVIRILQSAIVEKKIIRLGFLSTLRYIVFIEENIAIFCISLG